MTLRKLYNFGRKELALLDSPAFDCSCLAEKFLGADRKYILINGDLEADPRGEAEFLKAVAKRKENYPLQYLLGYWYFAGMKLSVMEGVLIPREDTECLVSAAVRYIGTANMEGVDLCAGTGAVALAVAQECTKAKITAVELFDVPLQCLSMNTERYGLGRVHPKRLDVLQVDAVHGFDKLDFILSNPPYIESGEIDLLQPEVRLEPRTALDGGKDGLEFYRCIVKGWKSALKTGGLLAFEIGEAQGGAVERLMAENGFVQIATEKDFSGLDRVVSGIKE